MSRRSNRKTIRCLNCGERLKSSYDYCPQCGQENTDLQLTFLQMLRDFFSNYFALDSRFGRSFKPFFLKPGFLTDEFMKGKRMSYANPIRLYIVISVIHFFVFSIYFSAGQSDNRTDERVSVGDSTLFPGPGDRPIEVKDDTLKITLGSQQNMFDVQRNINIIERMKNNHSEREIYDSLQLENKSFLTRLTWKQVIKLAIEGESTLQQFFLKNIPILMFFLLPVYALILKIFFVKKLYLNHLIHSLHLHSFVFVILTLLWILYLMVFESSWLFFAIFLLLCVYITQSFKKTYQITTGKAIFKVVGTGMIYSIVLSFSLLLTLVISFLTF